MESQDIKNLVSKMTLEEKAGLCSGEDFWHTKAVERLNIPAIMMSDGPYGLRKQEAEADHLGINESIPAVCFPTGVSMASSFNRELVKKLGETLGEECQAENIAVLLGPAMNIKRSPLCGRNFEYYSEDPYVSSQLASAYIKGLQSKHIGACPKHFYANNMEEKRMTASSEVDERTLREIYLAPFEMAVQEAKPWSIMCSYNKINGIYAAENKEALTDILRNEWGFDGFVVSDWGAMNDRVPDIQAGMDLEMPASGGVNDRKIIDAVRNGTLEEAVLDRTCERLLEIIYRYQENRDTQAVFDLERDHDAAKKIAEECMVLLKNDNVLPLKKEQKIAFIGPMANNRLHLLGSWSAHGDEKDVISILDGVKKEKGFLAKNILFAEGCGFDGNEQRGFAEAIRVAEQADIIIACLGEKKTWSGENASRSVIALPRIQEELLENLKKTGKPLVVLLSSGRPLDLSRIEPLADAMLEIWQPGITAGIAVAGILSGRYNPSGKLPITFPYTTGQIPIYYNHRKSGRTHQGKYQNITSEPLYSFGHGLSYTKFEYGTLKLSSSKIRRGDTLRAEIEVKNVGNYDGKETLLWFVADPFSSITRPVKELKYFEKKEIPAGESRIFTFDINLERDLGFVNEDGKRLLENGIFYIMVKDQKVKIELID